MKKIRKTILYVDDIHFSLVTLRDRLKDHYEVFLAQSVEKMYETLENYFEKKAALPHLILLDLNMPEVDGFAALKKLKQEYLYCDIPVVILSSKSDKKTMLTAIEHGAADFIAKPFTDTSLIECIDYQLGADKYSPKRPIILAVDDNPSILKAVKHIIGDKYIVYLLQEPEKVREFLKRIEPDLFLLDCNMPKLSGYDLVPIIRETELHMETPIIYLTSDGTIDNLSAAVGFGASDFIVKPIDETVLCEKLAEHLEGFLIHRHIRELEAES